MEEFKLEGAEYIELKSLLKVTNLVETGGAAKAAITEGLVKVNGEVETRKANKIKAGMIVTFEGQSIKVIG
jgi:ribosome-associated protein